MNIEEFFKRYWACIAKQDEKEIREYFHVNAYIRWHNTNEEFSVTEFLRANCDYPGSWSGEVKRIEQSGNSIITVAHIWAEGASFHVTSFFTMEDKKIIALDEYWGDDGVAPQWRTAMHIGQPIR